MVCHLPQNLDFMKSYILIFLLFNSVYSFGQNHKSELEKFVSEDYKILDYEEGDLNQDGISDVLLLLKEIDEENRSDVLDYPAYRLLKLLIRQDNNRLIEVISNDKVVFCYDCGGMMGDPYQGLSIENGKFGIHHYGGSGWRWNHSINFQYDSIESDWFFLNEEILSYHASNPDSTMTEEIKTSEELIKTRFKDYNLYLYDE